MSGPSFDFAPHRLSGVVYGVLMNDPAALAALGEQVHKPPYKAPPQHPVLYLKPRNTLSSSGDALCLPPGFDELEVGANLGLVIGRVACRVSVETALDHVAGCVLVNDVTLPHASCYRPSIRFRARDGYCPLGPVVAPRASLPPVDEIDLRIRVGGELVQRASTGGRIRSAARLLADVTAFMSLQPGDVLLLGASHGAPRVRAGQRVSIQATGLGTLENHVVAEPVPEGKAT
jgi:5-oxopent-3-ene-1,2,5-tricarboxylate decarboxylase / 2-hydroxyhepta-2,4-diene-1,7-dioate isomerase